MTTWESRGIDPLAAQILSDTRKIVEAADKDIATEIRAQVLQGAAVMLHGLGAPRLIKPEEKI